MRSKMFGLLDYWIIGFCIIGLLDDIFGLLEHRLLDYWFHVWIIGIVIIGFLDYWITCSLESDF